MSKNKNSKERRVRLFYDDGHQTVHIPTEFELDGDEAIMSCEGDKLILKSISGNNLLEVLRSLGPLEEIFPEINDFQVEIDEPDLGR